ncbi:hypothetical protein [Streptomyces sp. NPDC056549]|uniref:hypothetical protein n=1 Tax=Streptomyces sp. NPDC056549 TaxID=3345864 RepID=UPI00368620B8
MLRNKTRPAKEHAPIVVDAMSVNQRRQEDVALVAKGQRIADAMTKRESEWGDYQRDHARDIQQWERRPLEDDKAKMPEALAYEPRAGAGAPWRCGNRMWPGSASLPVPDLQAACAGAEDFGQVDE